ncbi:hypothetical protein [Microbulbifer sp. GL-2]|uniref:hypothetical protein n=1 Tax=Microbulbifer sp. GL-2 TaxID=2591606 RepID=UPI0011627742|nr:hypothetical protein [Microbulbifer sp. GL-2]BBM03789.1 hypothetical protein GL2_38630 [Microbulbifer sp. GL-2]
MKTPNINTIQQNGEYGNLCVATGKAIYEGDPAGTIGSIIKLPAMTKIIGLRMVNDALGSSTTVEVSAVSDSDGTQVLPATSTASAGAESYSGKSILLPEPTALQLTLAGGSATGDVECIVEYVYVGA